MTTGAEWLDQGRRLLDVFLQGPAGPGDDDTAGHRSDCTWCPVCQIAAVLRGERPEVSAALADVLDATANALRTFAAAGPGPQPPAGPDGDRQDGAPPPTVQQIEIA